jgi:hypothetical protein
MLWGADDTLGRWLQGLCAIVLFAFAALVFKFFLSIWTGAAACGAAYLGYRCARYALTGKNNINRDNF